MKLNSPIQSNFAMVPDVKLQRSKFNRNHGHKTTFDTGYLIPIYCDEALPGDTFNLKMTAFCRVSTLIKPIMDNMYLDSFFFAVPYRLVWENWEKFNGAQDNPGDSIAFTIPTLTSGLGGFTPGEIFDYMGIPTGKGGLVFSALWCRAYNLIYNTWFKDQNLINNEVVPLGNSDNINNYTLLKRAKRKDYFTSCLPSPQKSALPVTLPLGTTAPVIGDNNYSWMHMSNAPTEEGEIFGFTDQSMLLNHSIATAGQLKFGTVAHPEYTGLVTDLSSATAASINSLRQAMQIQKMLERDARGGTRYVEIIKSHFGVTSPDFRLQRPEYLGGGSSPINISPVSQTSVTAGTPQGNLAGIGSSVAQHGFIKSFTEHCLLLGIINVRGDLTYQQGINKMFTRSTRYDFYWPSFSHLGEQTVLNKEIYADASPNDDLAFGYQERYAEYRFKPSIISGKFKSGIVGTLDSWHLAQNFGSLPVLGKTFIEENIPLASRCLAVSTEPEILFDSFFDLTCVRPMPVYSIPGLMDHF